MSAYIRVSACMSVMRRVTDSALLRKPQWIKDTANSTDAENPACFSSSSLRTYSMFSIALAVFIAVAHFQ